MIVWSGSSASARGGQPAKPIDQVDCPVTDQWMALMSTPGTAASRPSAQLPAPFGDRTGMSAASARSGPHHVAGDGAVGRGAPTLRQANTPSATERATTITVMRATDGTRL